MLLNLYLNKTKKSCQRKIVGNSRIFCRFGKNDLKEIVKNGVKVGEKIIQKQENLPALLLLLPIKILENFLEE